MKGKYVIFSNENNQVRIYLIPESAKHYHVETPEAEYGKPFKLESAAQFEILFSDKEKKMVVRVFGESLHYHTKARPEDIEYLTNYFEVGNEYD